MSHSFFIAIVQWVDSVFCMKTVKSRLFKIMGTVLFVSLLATYQWQKIIENFNSVGAGAHRLGKSS